MPTKAPETTPERRPRGQRGRTVDTSKAEKARSPEEKLAELRKALDKTPYNHNECRRIMRLMLLEMTAPETVPAGE